MGRVTAPLTTDTKILVTRSELEFASGLRGRLRDYVANTYWPASSQPTMLELEPEPFGPFAASTALTRAGACPGAASGHTPGQIGALVDEGDHTVVLAGDSSYTQELMLRGKVDGVGADDEAERLTHERIRAFALATPTRHLVAHDPDTGTRLAERRLLHSVEQKAAA